MAQKTEDKNERPLKSHNFKNFLAVNTTNQRTACPKEAFWQLQNAQPIGFSNLHSIPDISALLHNYGADIIYYDQSVNISGTEYLIQASSTGKLFAYNVAAQTTTQINGAITLSSSNVRITQFQNSLALIIDSTGYYQWTGSGNITLITGTGAPTNGAAIGVYANRVWIAQGRVLFFSVAGSNTDFTAANGGGFTTLVDPVLRSAVIALYATNGYLYIFGLSSIQALSDVYVPAGAAPPTPNFTLLPLNGVIGTDQPFSIQAYGRLVLFANRYGAWSLYGTTLTQISGFDPNNAYNSSIDGTWQYVNFGQTISGGQFTSNNLFCSAFLIQRQADPSFGTNTVIAVYQGNAAGGRWWFANWGAITRITTAYVNNQPALFGYIGNQLFQLFANLATSPPAVISTALWDFDDPIVEKQVIKAGVQISAQQIGTGVTLTLDTTAGSTPINFNTVVGQVQWINNSAQIVTWINNSLQPVQWATGLWQTYWGAVNGGFAKYVGYTLTTTQGMVFELNAFLMDYKEGARWSGTK